MLVNREFLGVRYLIAFFISTGAFIIFFLIAQSISYFNYKSVSEQQNIIEKTILDFEDALKNFSCNNFVLLRSSEQLDDVAYKLTILEKRFGKKDVRVLEQKKLYSELEYRHFVITRKFNSECNTSYITVLFFYSNRDKSVEIESERMGLILTTFERKNAEKIMIYSFDYDLDLQIIKELITKYKIERVPVVVINSEDVIFVKHINELDKYLLK